MASGSKHPAHNASRPPSQGLTYRDAGVDIDAGNALVEAIKPLSASTKRPGADGALGGFGGLFDLKAAGFEDPVLVAANDGVGTKLKLAIDTGIHDTVGIDLVAMCVNDLVVQGAEPLFFLDYYACGALSVDEARDVVSGIADGCVQAGCALIGGETAEMPGMYRDGDYDLAGFAVGAAERGRLLPSEDIRPGDVLIGLPSSGPHSNGFSLIRKIVETNGLKLEAPCPFDDTRSLGAALLEPTSIYVKPVLDVIRSTGAIKALCHITGGGFTENIPRVLPDEMAARIDLSALTPQPVFGWLARTGGIDDLEMLRTFNCGVGMIAVVPADDAEDVRGRFSQHGLEAKIVGDVFGTKREGIGRVREESGVAGMTRKRTAILISGRGSNMASLIDAAKDPDYPAEICLVLSNRPDAAGLKTAENAGIRSIGLDHKQYEDRAAFDAELQNQLDAKNIELICLAGFMRLLTDDFVSAWRDRMINIHPSLLPSYKGLNTHERVLRDGGRITGCTVHFVRPAMDEGPIIAQAAVGIRADDTPDTLAARVLTAEHRIYPMALKLVASGAIQVTGELARYSGEEEEPQALISPAISGG